MSPVEHHIHGRAYWQSLEQLAESDEVRQQVEREFPDLASEGASRRDFLKLMAASMTLAGLTLTGCRRWPEQRVVPYAARPEGRAPGAPERYATQMEVAGVAKPLLVTSYDGRPIKVEGNPEHPASGGAADAHAQASVLQLYDPDRSRRPVERDGERTRYQHWANFERFAGEHFAAHRETGGRGLAVLAEASASPSLLDMRRRFQKAYPEARWHTYEPLLDHNAIAGARRSFGRPVRRHWHLDKATVVAAFDVDLLGAHPNAARHARAWAARRRQADKGEMNRLYAVESNYTVTGAAADHRHVARHGSVAELLGALAAELGVVEAASSEPTPEWVKVLARDLRAHRGDALVAVGAAQPPQAHALADAVNDAIGAAGGPVTYTDEPLAGDPGLVELAGRMRAGEVDTLVILGGNPVYDAPADAGFGEALDKVGTTIHLGLYRDETARRCRWHLPRAHYMEAWGDARSWDGAAGIAQPLIQPLFDGRSPIELLALLTGDEKRDGEQIVRRSWQRWLPASDFEAAWRRVVHDGIAPETRLAPVSVEASPVSAPASDGNGEHFDLLFMPDPGVFDGRFANLGWLQETPNPMTTVTWDNPALLAKRDADALGVSTGEMVTIEHGGRSLDIPVYIMPGQAPGTIGLTVGYGRGEEAGRIAAGTGFDTYRLRTGDAPWAATGARLRKAGGSYALAMTQNHHLIDTHGYETRQERAAHLVHETTLDHYREDPHFVDRHEGGGHEKTISLPLWDDPESLDSGAGYKWGMAIDLNSCIGCNACVVACQAENNVPVVGKSEVLNSREMQWLRIDRYFRGDRDDESPAAVHQPVPCMHCENAPCEQVCPVAATVHDTEGLNVMIYNRCIGVRYCSNNCPYKVRRFNFMDYHSRSPGETHRPWLGIPDTEQRKEVIELKRMHLNPEVTVRMRGVMEKCTYCTQRINAAKFQAKEEHAKGERETERVRDGEVTPACAQACPTEAIVFGDLNDPESRVRKLHNNHRTYGLLDAHLDTKPRTKYLAKIRNPAGGGENGHGGDAHGEKGHA